MENALLINVDSDGIIKEEVEKDKEQDEMSPEELKIWAGLVKLVMSWPDPKPTE